MIGIVMGSASDLGAMKGAAETLEALNIPFEVRILSAHRTPDLVAKYAETARQRGIKVIIAAAGGAAHLAGVIAASTSLPVLGCPMHTSSLGGVDSLYSMVQMPRGIPVATLAIGNAGAVNAALFAAAIVAVADESVAKRLEQYRVDTKAKAIADDQRLDKALQKRGDHPSFAAALEAAGLGK